MALRFWTVRITTTEKPRAQFTPHLCGGLLSLIISSFKSRRMISADNIVLKSYTGLPLLSHCCTARWELVIHYSDFLLVKDFHISALLVQTGTSLLFLFPFGKTLPDSYLASFKIIKLWPLADIISLQFEGCAYILRLLARKITANWTDRNVQPPFNVFFFFSFCWEF